MGQPWVTIGNHGLNMDSSWVNHGVDKDVRGITMG